MSDDYRGDFALGVTRNFKFSTTVNGVPTAMAGSPVLAAYVDGGTTEITAGVTLTEGFDGRVGFHNVALVLTSGNGYASATEITVVFSAGTLGGQTLVGRTVFTLSIDNRAAGLDAASLRAALGLASANLDTQLTTIDDFLDTEVAAIKAKTDNLPAAPAAVGDIPTALQNADALLARDIGSGTNAVSLNERTVRSALRFNRNRFKIAGGVLTVYCENDSTVAFTAAIIQTAGNPVSESDPT